MTLLAGFIADLEKDVSDGKDGAEQYLTLFKNNWNKLSHDSAAQSQFAIFVMGVYYNRRANAR